MQKDKKSFDVTTARKLIGDYAEKLNLYMKENQNLKNQIEDLKMTLKINKDLLFKYISTNVQQTEQISFLNDYKNDNMKLSDKNEKLHMDKNNLEKKIYKFQQESEDNNAKLREEIDKFKEEIFLLKNKLNEKESSISMIKRDYENKQPLSPHIVFKELFVSEPTRVNVELNNELNYSRELISKVSKMMNVEKLKGGKLEVKIAALNEEINQLKKIQVGEPATHLKERSCCGNKKNLELDLSECISLSDDEEEEEDDLSINFEDNVDSDDINFPDKVTYTSITNIPNKSPLTIIGKDKLNIPGNYNSHSPIPLKLDHKKSNSYVPKLDFKIIQNKYLSDAMKEKANNPADKKKSTAANSKVEDESAKVIEKLKNELRLTQNSLKELKIKLEKYRNAYKDSKAKLKFAKQTVKHNNKKITNLEIKVKKYSIAIAPPSTDDLSFKRVGNTNTSMNIYTGRSIEEIDISETVKS